MGEGLSLAMSVSALRSKLACACSGMAPPLLLQPQIGSLNAYKVRGCPVTARQVGSYVYSIPYKEQLSFFTFTSTTLSTAAAFFRVLAK